MLYAGFPNLNSLNVANQNLFVIENTEFEEFKLFCKERWYLKQVKQLFLMVLQQIHIKTTSCQPNEIMVKILP